MQSDFSKRRLIRFSIFAIILFCVYLLMFYWNYKTPYLDDNFSLANLSFSEIIKAGIGDYFHWNGRFFGQSFARVLLMHGVFFGSILSSLGFIIMTYLTSILVKGVTRYDISFTRVMLVIFSIFLFTPGFSTVYLWKTGVGNYLITLVMDLLYLVLVMNDNNSKIVITISCLVGFIAGWGNENTSGAIILIIILQLIDSYYHNHKMPIKKALSVFFVFVGFIFLLMSPGSAERARTLHSYFAMSITDRLWYGLSLQMNFFTKQIQFVVFMCVVILITVFAYFYWKDNPHLIDGIIFIVASFAAIFVLIISPQGMNISRTYLGPFILMLIGVIKLIPYSLTNIRDKAIIYMSLYVVAFLSLIFVTNGMYESKNFNEQLNNRYAQIINAKKCGKNRIVLQALNYPYNRYSLSDVYFELTNNKNYFPNSSYEYGFKMKSIILKKP